MMLKKLNAMMLFSIFLLSGVLLGGCSTNANSLVGTWKEVDRTATMTFYEDKNMLRCACKKYYWRRSSFICYSRGWPIDLHYGMGWQYGF